MTVTPLSALVVNGDITHASLARKNASTAFLCAADTIKYHINFVKAGYGLPEGIHYFRDLKSRFPEPPCSNQDNLDAVEDAVCGASPVLEKPSTETPAAPRRSEETKLGSPATLSQQADCVIGTKRAGRSCKKNRSKQYAKLPLIAGKR